MKQYARADWIVAAALWGGLMAAGCGASPASVPAPGGDPHFTDVTEAAGLGGYRHVTGAFGEEWFPETMGSGAAFVDLDGDGWVDLVAAGGGMWEGHDTLDAPVPAVYLFRNNGDGTFADVTAAWGVGALESYSLGVAAADYDNDGDRDLYVGTLFQDLLLRNDAGPGGTRTFTDVTAAAGLTGHSDWSTATIFFDADRDGWVDLYVGNYVEWDPENDLWCTMDGMTKSYCTPQAYTGVLGRYYRNDGDGTFTEQTEAAGFGTSPGKTLGAAELDFNQDGWPDLAVANDTQRDLLLQNNGDGTFTERGVMSGLAFDENGRARAGMGIDAGDVDNSGNVTIVIGHFANEMTGVYRYAGDGLFVERTAASKIGQASLLRLTFGIVMVDADLDGWLDVFAANGHIAMEAAHFQDGIGYEQPAQLFMNRRDGTFEDVAGRVGGALEQHLVARGIAYADYDRDGDLDVLLTENGGRLYLWRNDQAGGRSVRIHLEGRASNRDALGARLVAVTGTNRMERRVKTGGSFLTQSETAVTFGLGTADAVDSLYVYWPSGREDRFGRIPAGRELRLVEGETTLAPMPARPGALSMR